jgi:hypothetical protein
MYCLLAKDILSQRVFSKQGTSPPPCKIPDLAAYHLLFLLFTSAGSVPGQPQVPLLELFALDSDCNQRDGTTADSLQALWLQQALTASSAVWKFVMLHHSPYSSSTSHGTNPRTQW